MKKQLTILSLLAISLLFIAPAEAAKLAKKEVITSKTQLDKQQYQIHQYSGVNKTILMKAILNVLQDEGYIINNANSLLGFISGTKEFSTFGKSIDLVKEFGSPRGLYGAKVAVVEVSVNVTESGKDFKVRMNFKRKLLNTYGNAQRIDEINNEEYYQKYFSLVDDEILALKKVVKK